MLSVLSLFSAPAAGDVLLLAVILTFLLLAALLGLTAAPRQPVDAGMVPGAVLSLSGLLIGFAFSIAITGYATRNQALVRETVAASRAWQYSGLLGDRDRETAQRLTAGWLDARIHFFREGTRAGRRTWQALSEARQQQLWSLVRGEARQTVPGALNAVLAAVSDLGAAQQQTQSVWHRQLPDAAWLILVLFAGCGSYLAGRCHPSGGRAGKMLLLLPALTGLTLFTIAETDLPGEGIIRVMPSALEQLAERLPAGGEGLAGLTEPGPRGDSWPPDNRRGPE